MHSLTLVLLSAAVLSALGVLTLFIGRPSRPRLPLAARAPAAAVAAGLLTLGAAALLGAEPWGAGVGAVVIALAVMLNAPVSRAWTTRGLVTWASALTASVGYLTYVGHWLITSHLGALALVAGGTLWLLEGFVFVLSVGYLWELVDVLARWDWSRRIELRQDVEKGRAGTACAPFVSLHVPTHNEPPDLVVATLRRLLDLQYADYEVLVLDNNTDDPALWQPVERFCAKHERLRFFHLEDWPGYKSGALNFGLEQTDPRAQLIGVVDADYFVEPDFLRRCAPQFADPALGFLQTPQDYRDWETDRYFRRLYYSYAYFFDVSQRSRNERNGAIFGGTMGLIRRSALEQVGGWDEWCITEDAELSLRLLRAGWHGSHVEKSFGHGIMPLTFEALKRQRFRWCFGGVQILRLHWRSLLPGPRTEANRMDAGQRWAYLVGALQWFGDLAALALTAFLLLGAVDALTGSGVVVRRLSGVLLVCVLGLVLLGAVRSIALVHRASGARWGDAFGAFGLWSALGWVVALGSVRGLLAREGAFLRTPKFRGRVSWREALRANTAESILLLICLAGAGTGFAAQSLGGAIVGTLLLLQGAGHAMAPYNSLAAIRADLTPELRRRRREKRPSWTRVRPGMRRWGVGPAVAAALCAGLLVAVAAPVGGPAVTAIPRTIHPAPSVPSRAREVRTTPTATRPATTPDVRRQVSPSAVPARVRKPSSTPPSATVAASRLPTAAPSQAATRGTRPAATTPAQVPSSRPGGRPSAKPSPASGHTRSTPSSRRSPPSAPGRP